jgi:hypothetical protein
VWSSVWLTVMVPGVVPPLLSPGTDPVPGVCLHLCFTEFEELISVPGVVPPLLSPAWTHVECVVCFAKLSRNQYLPSLSLEVCVGLCGTIMDTKQ